MIKDVTRDPIRRRVRLILGATFFALLFITTGVNMYRGLAVLGRKSEPGWAANQIGSLIFIEPRSAETTARRSPAPGPPGA